MLLLLTATAVAIVVFFARDPRGESTWRRLIAPAVAAVLLGGIVVLATRNYATLLGVPTGSPAAWILPGSYLAVAVIGVVWALVLHDRRPDIYDGDRAGPARHHQPAHPRRRQDAGMSAGPGEPLPRRRRPQHHIVTATAADTDALSQVIADAFHDLPQSQWLIGDPAARRDILPGYFRILVEHALASGTVHTTPDRSAAALWIPIGADGASPPRDYAARLAEVTGPWADRFTAFDAALERHHPANFAHHHLAILAVHPTRQRQGTGTALLRAYHQVLDQGLNLPAYLEAAQWRTRQLYRRHGYLPSGVFYLPDGGPPMFPMARPAQRLPAGLPVPGPGTGQPVIVPQQRPAPETRA